MTPDAPASSADTTEPQSPAGRSPNWGAPLILCALLYGAASQGRSAWGLVWHGLYVAAVLLGAYTAFSNKEFEAERRRAPGTTRFQHIVWYGVPYVLFPVAGWLLAILAGSRFGTLVPALPWVALVLPP